MDFTEEPVDGSSESPSPDADIDKLSTEQYLRHGDRLMSDGDNLTPSNPSVETQIARELEYGTPLETVMRGLRFDPEEQLYHQVREGKDLTRTLSDGEALRLLIYRELSDKADYRIADLTKVSGWRRKVMLRNSLSEKTIGSIEQNTPEELVGEIRETAKTLARQFEGTDVEEDLRSPPEPEALTDGTGPPSLIDLTRTVKSTGYSCIQIGRTGNVWYDKWEVFKPFELAAKDKIHLNDARENLKLKSYYWERKTPGSKTVWNQMRTFSRGRFRLMFLCAFEQFLNILDRYDLIPDEPEVAIDITGWPWFGKIDDDDTPIDEREQPVGVEGTKPGRNYSHAWQFATISLVNCEIPMTFGVRSVKERSRRSYHVHHLLNYAESKFDVSRVYLDKDFYTRPVKDELENRGTDFVVTAPRNMGEFHDLIDGTALRKEAWNSMPYEINVDGPKDADHYLFVNPSEKRLKRADTGLEDHKNWEAYYTSLDPTDVDGGGDALAEDYRLRWAVETSYRMLKENFMPKSATPMRNQRVFLFNMAVLYNNMWMAANVLAAAGEHDGDGPIQVKDGQGNYPYTANQFMTSR